jgi:hypothetical protein
MPGGMYIFQVKAHNPVGYSVPIESPLVIMKNVPSISGVPQMREFTNTSILLQWKRPDSDNGYPILRYDVYISTNDVSFSIVNDSTVDCVRCDTCTSDGAICAHFLNTL